MKEIFQSNGGLGRARVALVISIIFDVVLGVFAGITYAVAPSSLVARVLDRIGVPAQALTYWLAPGHTGVQPLLALFFSVFFSWLVVWSAISLPTWWHHRQ